jgi:amidohydrolase
VGSGAGRQESGVRSQWTFYLFSQLWRSPLPTSNQYCQQGNIIATIAGEQPGLVLAIRTDMNALPIDKENQAPYLSSHPRPMHACGDNGDTTITLGTTSSKHKISILSRGL